MEPSLFLLLMPVASTVQDQLEDFIVLITVTKGNGNSITIALVFQISLAPYSSSFLMTGITKLLVVLGKAKT